MYCLDRNRNAVPLLFWLILAPAALAEPHPQTQLVIEGAMRQIGKTVLYEPAYRVIAYPGGDVPIEIGVCTDVVIRSLRHASIDLQKEVHEDMRRAFKVYPKTWGLTAPDANIDHRRVPNLMTFFQRAGKRLPITTNPADYHPGDILAWELPSGFKHVGVVSSQSSIDRDRHLVIHNIGAGAQIEDVLFAFTIIGHYRFFKETLATQ